MRIAHVDSGAAWGGGQKQVLLLARWQHERGRDVVVVAPPDSPLRTRCASLGIAVEPVDAIYPWNPWAIRRVVAAVRNHGAEVVHSHTPKASAILGMARRLGLPAPHVTTRRTAFPVSGYGRGIRAGWAYGGGLDGLIAISQAAAHPVLAAGGRPRRLAIIPSGVEPAAATGGGVVWPPFLPEGLRRRVLVGCVASLVPEKGVGVLLRAWRRVARSGVDAALVIAGEGPQRPALADEIAAFGLDDRVHLCGWIDEPESLHPHLSMLVHPALVEALGNAVLEAMAAGVPVIAAATGGLPEVLASGRAGVLVPPRDPVRLAAAILDLLDDDARARRLAAAARRRASEVYGIDRVATAIEGFYAGIVEGG